MNPKELASEIRKINRANGWNLFTPTDWFDKYKFPAIIALIHSEITEAFDEFQLGNTVELLTEIADVKIRCLDVLGGMALRLEPMFDQSTLFEPTEALSLLGMHKDASIALESFRVGDKERAAYFLVHLILRVDHFAESYANDFDAILDAKIAKNRRRSYRHGNKRV